MCNDADESAHKDDGNESVNNDITRKSLYALVKMCTETMWRLTDGNRKLQSSVISCHKKCIQRLRSGYPVDIQ